MKVWIYAMKQGFKAILVIVATIISTASVLHLIYNGFRLPPAVYVFEVSRLMLFLVVLSFPFFVVAARYEVWRNHRKKVS